MVKTILYDLDGTLLPMDMEVFTNAYFGYLVKKMIPYGYEKDSLIKAIWGGTKMMVKNDGNKTNEDAFWEYFLKEGNSKIEDKEIFNEYYEVEFDQVKAHVGFNEKVPALIKKVKELGLRQALATNPIFPSVATKKRVSWAGLSTDDFEYFTTYENSHFCKPNPKYYEELLKKIDAKPEECLMIGNDVEEDMVAASSLGIKVFLVTDWMLNPNNKDISAFPHGDFDDALEYIKKVS